MVQGKINKILQFLTQTIRLGATASGLTSAHLHHPPIFYRPDALPAAQLDPSVRFFIKFGWLNHFLVDIRLSRIFAETKNSAEHPKFG